MKKWTLTPILLGAIILSIGASCRVHAQPNEPCPSGIDEQLIDTWLADVPSKRHTATKYSGLTKVSNRRVCNKKHWVVGKVKNNDEDVVDYQGRYSIFPPDDNVQITASNVLSGLPWQINLADGHILYPIEPLFSDGPIRKKRWSILKEPESRPVNVPLDSVWVGGLDRKEAYVRISHAEGGLYRVWRYELFRQSALQGKDKQTRPVARLVSGPLNYIIQPERLAQSGDMQPIFIDQHDKIVLLDGRILVQKR